MLSIFSWEQLIKEQQPRKIIFYRMSIKRNTHFLSWIRFKWRHKGKKQSLIQGPQHFIWVESCTSFSTSSCISIFNLVWNLNTSFNHSTKLLESKECFPFYYYSTLLFIPFSSFWLVYNCLYLYHKKKIQDLSHMPCFLILTHLLFTLLSHTQNTNINSPKKDHLDN